MSPLLSLRDLHVRFPRAGRGNGFWRRRPAWVDIVLGVSLDIGRGETVAVVGESGSGKTTLAMALSGLLPLAGGEVWCDGRKMAQERDRRLKPDRRRMALMFQDPVGSLSPRMTVRRLLAEPFRIHPNPSRDPDLAALALLAQVGLSEEFADRYPHQLSGGQARRVGVARALALRPDILIADEPTAGLDVSIQGEVLNLLSNLQREMGLGIMIITHNLHVVRHVSDRMAIMYLGRLVELGDTERIFHQPRHPYTAALLAANPSPDPDAERQRIELAGEVPGPMQRPEGCEFHTRCPRARAKCMSEFPASTVREGRHTFRCHYPMKQGG